METKIITRRICLNDRFLDHNIRDHMLCELTTMTKNECTKEYGYILSINTLDKILSHEIGRANGGNIFTLKFKADTLNPVVGKEVTGVVFHVFAIGIFINVMGKQKILVPVTSLKNYVFNELTSIYEHSENSDIINVGDSIIVTITDSQYNSGGFSCLGILKDK